MATFIKKVRTEHMGGGCMLDLVTLNDGRVLGITNECVVLYKNMDDALEQSWEENHGRPMIDLIVDSDLPAVE